MRYFLSIHWAEEYRLGGGVVTSLYIRFISDAFGRSRLIARCKGASELEINVPVASE